MGFIFDCLHPDKERVCPVCGKKFEARSSVTIYCCIDCANKDKHAYSGRREGKGATWVEKHWQRSAVRHICPMCGSLSINAVGCCREHQRDRVKEVWDYGKREAEELIRRGFGIDLSKSEGTELQLYERLTKSVRERELNRLVKTLKRLTRKRQIETKKEQKQPRKCPCCGKMFVPNTAAQIYCSKPCGWKGYIHTERGRAIHNSAKNNRQRCRKFGVKYDSSVNSLDVFNRDHWICQLCFRKLSKKNAGKLIGDAPTVDHIKPLSQGGSHTWDNVQCACRRCNLLKSDGVRHSSFSLS